jgi:hypothetical protein
MSTSNPMHKRPKVFRPSLSIEQMESVLEVLEVLGYTPIDPDSSKGIALSSVYKILKKTVFLAKEDILSPSYIKMSDDEREIYNTGKKISGKLFDAEDHANYEKQVAAEGFDAEEFQKQVDAIAASRKES